MIDTVREAIAFIRHHGVVLESGASKSFPSLAAEIAGGTIRGSWWSHSRSRTIFAITRGVRDHRDILVCRLIDNKITFVHRRLWTELARVADQLPAASLAQIREVHTAAGQHETVEVPFPEWLRH